MDKTLGAYSILACQKAMDDAGVSPDQIDGVICCDSHIAGGSGGSASQWAPRSYFAPPYDSEWGLTLINAAWLIEHAGFEKGHTLGRAAISTKHALALTNRGGATAAEIVALARRIKEGVETAFGVTLRPEPVLVGFDGDPLG